MPTAPLRPCTTPHCGNLTSGGPCPQHARQREASRYNADVRKWYHRNQWRHPVWGLRAIVLREQPWCDDCTQAGRLYVQVAEVHHVVKHEGDPDLFWDRANLKGLCSPCHSRRTAKGE